MLEKMKEYCEAELKSYKKFLANPRFNNPKTIQETTNSYIDRILGVAFFVQSLDVSYYDADCLYNEYREEILKELKNFLDKSK